VPFRVEIPYQLYERLKSWIALHDGEIRSESFGTAVTVEGVVPEEDREAFATHLTNLSGGTVRLG
jgi:putative IMPACT (imprinted ancient) family translation regulator